MSTAQTTAETGAAVAAKIAPPISVSLATIAGYNVSELVLWGTLIYTCLMIGHKIIDIYRDLRGKR
jgi:hypothetical protein